jgi:hypothetical protein
VQLGALYSWVLKSTETTTQLMQWHWTHWTCVCFFLPRHDGSSSDWLPPLSLV